MKKSIIKILSLFTFLFASIFLISTPSVEAASSSYSIAPSFTFSSDMDIDEGLDLIKPFILYQDGQPSTSNFTFNYEKGDGNWYRFYGTYPDGSNYSIHTAITIIDNASGTYVSAMMTQNYYRQSIYVKELNEGKTTNDCLLECWRDKFVSIKEPTYSVIDEPTQNIYPHMTSFESAAGTYNLMYYAVIENVNYTPDENPEDNANNTTDNSGSNNNPTNPGDDLGNNDNQNNGENNNQDPSDDLSKPGSSNNNKPNENDPPTDNQTPEEEREYDALDITLIVCGTALGIFLIYLIFKMIKGLVLWLRRF